MPSPGNRFAALPKTFECGKSMCVSAVRVNEQVTLSSSSYSSQLQTVHKPDTPKTAQCGPINDKAKHTGD